MSKRIKQVNELLRSVIGRLILEEIELPSGVFATVVKVDTAPNLKNSDVYISIVPDNKSQSSFGLLEKNIKYLQKGLAQNIQLRSTPKIKLKLDYTERNASHIEGMLDNL